MKKAISLITAMFMMFTFVTTAAYAANEVTEKTFTTTAKTEYNVDFGDLNGNVVVEINYNFENADFSELTNFNIPFIFKNENNAETARFSFLGDSVNSAATAKYLRTTFTYMDANGSSYATNSLASRSGFVEKKGKFVFLFSTADKKLYVQYSGESFKTDAFMGYCPFTYVKNDGICEQRTATGLGRLTIGASGCPAVDVSLKAYSVNASEAAKYKVPHTKYTYDNTGVSGAVSGLWQPNAMENPMDLKNADKTNITIENDEATGNGYIKVPAGKQYSLMFVPQNQGMEKNAVYTYVKYKQYIAADNPTFAGTNTTSIDKYAGTTGTALAITGKTSLKFAGDTVTVPDMTGKWTEIMRVFNPTKKTAALYVDGKKYITKSYSSSELDWMIFKFDNDMYIDDLEMGEYIPTAADNTFEESYTVVTGKTADKDLSDYNFGDKFIVDIDYDFSNSTVGNNLNIPFILRDSKNEIARYSIQDGTATASSQYFQTCYNERNYNGNANKMLETLGGLVGKKGNIKMLVETDSQKFSVKYTGEGYKTEQYMGTQSFRNMTEKITMLRIGAGGNPGVDLKVKVYSADTNAVNAFRKYKTAYTYNEAATVNNLYLDFKNSGSITFENGAVKIPAGQMYQLMLTPQWQGYTGKVMLQYRVKNVGTTDFNGNNSLFVTNYGEKGAVRTKIEERRIAFCSLSSQNAANGDTVYFATPYAVSGDWREVKYVVDLNAHKADLYVDGWYCNTVDIDADVTHINTLNFTFPETDVYIDDVTVETYADNTVKNTAKVNVETLENGDYSVMASYVDVNSTKGVMLIAVTYDENNKLVNIQKADIENNGAKTTISSVGANTVKAFLWENGNLRPLAVAK